MALKIVEWSLTNINRNELNIIFWKSECLKYKYMWLQEVTSFKWGP